MARYTPEELRRAENERQGQGPFNVDPDADPNSFEQKVARLFEEGNRLSHNDEGRGMFHGDANRFNNLAWAGGWRPEEEVLNETPQAPPANPWAGVMPAGQGSVQSWMGGDWIDPGTNWWDQPQQPGAWAPPADTDTLADEASGATPGAYGAAPGTADFYRAYPNGTADRHRNGAPRYTGDAHNDYLLWSGQNTINRMMGLPYSGPTGSNMSGTVNGKKVTW